MDLRKKFSLFNEKRRIINAKLGVLPLLWLTSLFLTLTATITEVVMNVHLYDTLLSRMAMAIEPLGGGAIILGLVFVSGMATDIGEQAKTTLVEIAQVLTTGTRSRSLGSVRRSLLIEIAQPVIPATAWDMFSVDKKLILKFAGSLISFAVMVTTTILQLKQANETDSTPKAVAL
ncbi:hypothetical protein HDE_05310 [Halotydeus destructor]|nr:hypothetical protein HDE_05310 [Halotydeus destructor]